MFLVPTQEVTTAFVSVFTCFFLVYTILMGNSEPIPTIFLKLGQIKARGVSGILSDLEKKLSASLPVMIYRNEQFSEFRAAWRTVALCIGPAARRRRRLARGKALSVTRNFSNTMQFMTVLKMGMSYLTFQVHTGAILEEIRIVLKF